MHYSFLFLAGKMSILLTYLPNGIDSSIWVLEWSQSATTKLAKGCSWYCTLFKLTYRFLWHFSNLNFIQFWSILWHILSNFGFLRLFRFQFSRKIIIIGPNLHCVKARYLRQKVRIKQCDCSLLKNLFS